MQQSMGYLLVSRDLAFIFSQFARDMSGSQKKLVFRDYARKLVFFFY